VKAAMELFSFGFMLVLGLKFLLATSVQGTSAMEAKLETRLHPHSAFMTGFVRVMGNPGVLLGWIILGAYFISREWVAPTWSAKGACVAGVAVGTGAWFVGLSYTVSLGHKKLSDKTLLRMEKGSGIGLLIFALIHGIQIAWELVRNHK
jgi:threonine/homoserine/homoserine lactone efflux protein